MLVVGELNYKMAKPVTLCDVLFSHYIPVSITFQPPLVTFTEQLMTYFNLSLILCEFSLYCGIVNENSNTIITQYIHYHNFTKKIIAFLPAVIEIVFCTCVCDLTVIKIKFFKFTDVSKVFSVVCSL